MVERLVAPRAQVLGDRLVPVLAVGEDRIDVEHHSAEIEQLVADDVADAEARLGVARSFDPAAGLRGVEVGAIHGHADIDYRGLETRFPLAAMPE